MTRDWLGARVDWAPSLPVFLMSIQKKRHLVRRWQSPVTELREGRSTRGFLGPQSRSTETTPLRGVLEAEIHEWNYVKAKSLAERGSVVLPCWGSQANMERPWPWDDQQTWLQPRREGATGTQPPELVSWSAGLKFMSHLVSTIVTVGQSLDSSSSPRFPDSCVPQGSAPMLLLCPSPAPIENTADYWDARRIRWSHGYESLGTVFAHGKHSAIMGLPSTLVLFPEIQNEFAKCLLP